MAAWQRAHTHNDWDFSLISLCKLSVLEKREIVWDVGKRLRDVEPAHAESGYERERATDIKGFCHAHKGKLTAKSKFFVG